MNRADLKLYTPDRWYYVQRRKGKEIGQRGFHTKEQADDFKKDIDQATAQWLAQGYKRRPGVTDEVVEATGWSVDGKLFGDFHEALWYMWNERPRAEIKGVF